jgi:methionine-rich copper-binding protein CopC
LRTTLRNSILQFAPLELGNIASFAGEGGILRCKLYKHSISILLALILVAGFARAAWAHAILMESKPALHASVKGPEVAIWLRFNVRIDGSRSRLRLVTPDGSQQTLPLPRQSSPDILQSQAGGLTPGTYKLQWQVLASDGHMSKGEVPFTVT